MSSFIKKWEADDPLALHGVALPEGDPAGLAECLIEEYLLMGYDEESLLALIRDPFFTGFFALGRELGEERLRALISRVRDSFEPSPDGDRSGTADKRGLEEVRHG